jgi:hypothetical protein
MTELVAAMNRITRMIPRMRRGRSSSGRVFVEFVIVNP